MTWQDYNDERPRDGRGSENGIVMRDEDYDGSARITLERDGDTAPFAITCGVYGWMVHTRFFAHVEEAESEYGRMKDALARIVEMSVIRDDDSPEAVTDRVSEAVGRFVAEHP